MTLIVNYVYKCIDILKELENNVKPIKLPIRKTSSVNLNAVEKLYEFKESMLIKPTSHKKLLLPLKKPSTLT